MIGSWGHARWGTNLQGHVQSHGGKTRWGTSLHGESSFHLGALTIDPREVSNEIIQI